MDMSIWKDVDVLRDEISKSYRHLAFDDYSTCPPSLPMVETCMPLPHVLSFLWLQSCRLSVCVPPFSSLVHLSAPSVTTSGTARRPAKSLTNLLTRLSATPSRTLATISALTLAPRAACYSHPITQFLNTSGSTKKKKHNISGVEHYGQGLHDTEDKLSDSDDVTEGSA